MRKVWLVIASNSQYGFYPSADLADLADYAEKALKNLLNLRHLRIMFFTLRIANAIDSFLTSPLHLVLQHHSMTLSSQSAAQTAKPGAP